MKKTIFVMAAALAVFALGACQSSPADTHNSRDSVDWAGVYAGTIPAADGPGIEVQITLHANETYEIQYIYIDRPGTFTDKGSFKWDEAGSIITLDTKDMPPYYKVGENLLIQLDMRGKEITGNFADVYVLHKML